jgi:hypothetical protein
MTPTSFLEYGLVGMGCYEWRCSCGATDTVPSLAVAYKVGNAHRKSCCAAR